MITIALTFVCTISAFSWSVEDNGRTEFFESRVRPILVEHCHACHSVKAGKAKGGLTLDRRESLLKGGDNGPVVVPGHPDKSRLIEAIRYGNVDLQMPPKGKLPDDAIAHLTKWIEDGAAWPSSDTPATKHNVEFDLLVRKASHWCWQPIQTCDPPQVKNREWPVSDIDKFVLAKLESNGLTPSKPAEPLVLLRRVHFALTGLPPTVTEIDSFLNLHKNEPTNALQTATESLLESPRFGERWARHWLDLVRYSETRGHEFDYPNPNAWQYRDYVIRALNADVPYDQFVREHIAGDLLPAPRRHPSQGFNESILGTGFWWLGEQVHSPVDLKQDEADRFENPIDVFGKTFLGLTVACARCHDHKFDAISTKDYYALYATLASSGYRQVRFETDCEHRVIAKQLEETREREEPRMRREIAKILLEHYRPLFGPNPDQLRAEPRANESLLFDFGMCTPSDWRPDGQGFGTRASRVGELRLGLGDDGEPMRIVCEAAAEADSAWNHLQSTKLAERDAGDLNPIRAGRTIRTPAFTLDGRKIYYRIRGQGLAYAAVHHHTMMEGPLHRKLVRKLDAGDDFQWLEHDLSRYAGHRVHFEFTATSPNFAVSRVVLAVEPPRETIYDASVDVRAALSRWASCGEITPNEAVALDRRLRLQDESQRRALGEVQRPVVIALREQIRTARMESQLAPAMYDGAAVPGRVFIRGNPKALGAEVPRRFLEALAGPRSFDNAGSGRMQLAQQVTDPTLNPLVARVIVNRVWLHLFGQGLVASVDNFGVLGETPSHPELLDYLADRFIRDGWSLKRLIRQLVLTRTYQQSSDVRPDVKGDPRNRLLHRMNLKRIEGEAIRDSLLQLSGRLNLKMHGPPVRTYLTPHMEGRGRPETSGPSDGEGRRSIYLEVRRNFLNPLLASFDTPSPFSTVGRRTDSNVPAQALTLLNDPFIVEQTGKWTEKTGGVGDDRIERLYLEAFARRPSATELAACRTFLTTRDWSALGHALVNTKEFIFVR